MENALALLARLPEDVVLSVNVSGGAFAHPKVLERLLGAATHRVVVEITEQLPVEDYRTLAEPLSR